MCRFALYLGPPASLGAVMTHPEHSLLEQARHCEQGREDVNADGCGAAWYPDGTDHLPVVFHDAAPAWQSPSWRSFGDTLRSHCILAHVRAATAGLAVTTENCHPFAWRELAFMHNGKLPELARFIPALRGLLSPRARRLVRGSTDSEHVFALLTDHWLALETAAPFERLALALDRTVATLEDLRRGLGIEGRSFLNLAVADGHMAVVSRFASPGREAAHTLYVRRSPQRANAVGVFVASEPLDHDRGWKLVPAGHLLQVDVQGQVVLAPLHPASDLRAA